MIKERGLSDSKKRDRGAMVKVVNIMLALLAVFSGEYTPGPVYTVHTGCWCTLSGQKLYIEVEIENRIRGCCTATFTLITER